jgi:hypothetical protein
MLQSSVRSIIVLLGVISLCFVFQASRAENVIETSEGQLKLQQLKNTIASLRNPATISEVKKMFDDTVFTKKLDEFKSDSAYSKTVKSAENLFVDNEDGRSVRSLSWALGSAKGSKQEPIEADINMLMESLKLSSHSEEL